MQILKLRKNNHQKTRNKKVHFLNCDTEVTFESVDILASSSLGENTLLTLEALYIKDIRPSINTKDEWKSKALRIRI